MTTARRPSAAPSMAACPTAIQPVYAEPLTIAEPLNLRAKAFRNGYSSSVVTNATFIVERR